MAVPNDVNEPVVTADDAPAGKGSTGHATTADERCLATTSRKEFYDSLQIGDVILFESLDELAVLAHAAERRPVYHSSIYVGKPFDPVNNKADHTILHNVSSEWWTGAASHPPHRSPKHDIGAPTDDDGRIDTLRRYWLPTVCLDADWRNDRDAIDLLLRRGGTGPMRLDAYLDSDVVEWLWGDQQHQQHVRKIRSAVALRHKDLVDPKACSPDQRPAVQKKFEHELRVLHRAINGDGDDGFPAAELVAFIPDIAERPGYVNIFPKPFRVDGLLFSPVRFVRRKILIRLSGMRFHEVDKGRRWICAMFCVNLYLRVFGKLEITDVATLSRSGNPYYTPRDLWDCHDLQPVAMLVVPPDRDDPSHSDGGSDNQPSSRSPLAATRTPAPPKGAGTRLREWIRIRFQAPVTVAAPTPAELRALELMNDRAITGLVDPPDHVGPAGPSPGGGTTERRPTAQRTL